MSTYYKVSSQVLRQKASQLREEATQFQNAVKQLADNEASLASMWEGDAKNAFRTAFNNDKAQFDNFYTGILKYVEALENAAKEYDRAEDQNVTIAKSRKA